MRGSKRTERREGDTPVEREATPVRAVRVHRPDTAPYALELDRSRRYVIGRAGNADIVCLDDAVSRLHGLLRADGGRWSYIDLESANGSFVFDIADAEVEGLPCERVGASRVALCVGQGVLIGSRRVWLELLSGMPSEAEAARASWRSAASIELDQRIELAARSPDVPVFLLGPSGAGKTHVAAEIHRRSGLAGGFEAIACARLSTDPTTLHSELLGHTRGAFTNAIADREGRLFAAHGGTLFLDEVDSLPDVAQRFLLDVLEPESTVMGPLGAPARAKAPRPRFRLIAASKRPLSESGLRPDLCERLAAGFLWAIPTLEERREDIPGLIDHFLREFFDERQVRVDLTRDAYELAQATEWPGQVRELRSTVRALASAAVALRGEVRGRARLLVHAEDFERRFRDREAVFGRPRSLISDDTASIPMGGLPTLRMDASPRAREASAGARPLGDARPIHPRTLEREDVERMLAAHHGNRTRTAKALGIARGTLIAKMRRFGLGPATDGHDGDEPE